MTWHHDQLDRIAHPEELRITTARPDGTYRQWTPIWVVRVGDQLYVRSAGGRTSDCYQHATQLPQDWPGRARDCGRKLPGRLR